MRVFSLAVQPSNAGSVADLRVVLENSSGSDIAVLAQSGENEGEVDYTTEDEVEVTWCPEGVVTATRGGGLLLVPANGKKAQQLSTGADVRSLSCIGAVGDVGDVGGGDDGSGPVSPGPSATPTTVGPRD